MKAKILVISMLFLSSVLMITWIIVITTEDLLSSYIGVSCAFLGTILLFIYFKKRDRFIKIFDHCPVVFKVEKRRDIQRIVNNKFEFHIKTPSAEHMEADKIARFFGY